ncbi:MAG: winged helix-turn-helix transcriptional regulator [Mycobacterium sp.]|nr:winged helix-turn-helix transcriptional regulator [Mycobacterium sp.]
MLGLLGDEWNLLIIQQAVMGATRYSHFTARLPISNAVLSNRLRTLVAEGLLDQHGRDYLATGRSRSLWPLLLLIWEWERTWVPERAGRLPDMSHHRCGRSFAPVLRCAACGQPAGPGNVTLSMGPSGDWQRCAPDSANRRRSDSRTSRVQAGLFPETMSVLGNRWAAALLVATFLGTNRFSDFQTQLGAPPSPLAERLQTFSEIGVLETHRGGAYLLTDKGRAFFGILATAVQWAQRWYLAPEGPAIVMTHRDCGAAFAAVLACDQCGEQLTGAQVAVTSAAVSETP